MTATSADTIVALATPPGVSARAILRMSGERAFDIARRVTAHSPGTPGEGGGEGLREATAVQEDPHPNPLPGYRERGPKARCVRLLLGDGLDVPATLLSFACPRSSTGEDVVEFHVPGSPWIVGRLLERLFAAGARQAEPGEFTSRAFFHGKLELASAEGVVATISASNRSSLTAARQLLAGELSRRLTPLMDRVAGALALVEVGIDFSEEDVTFIARDQLADAIGRTHDELRTLQRSSPQFERLDHEPRIVLAGRPNAGKSSLLNALAGKTRAIVADVAGTTRDALSERIALRNGYVTLVDVAGLEGDDTADAAIAAQMQSMARAELAKADHVVLVVACDDVRPAIDLARKPDLIVRSKSDLAPLAASDGVPATVNGSGGLAQLREALDQLVFDRRPTEAGDSIALNARHRVEIDEAIAALDRATLAIDQGSEFIATELRATVDHLGRILGHVSPDDVLGRIFSGFCIGK